MTHRWLSLVRLDPSWAFSYGIVRVSDDEIVVSALFSRKRVVRACMITDMMIGAAHPLWPLPAVRIVYRDGERRRAVTMLPVFRRNRTILALIHTRYPQATCTVPKGPPILLSLLPIAAFCSLLSPVILGIPFSETIGAVWMGLLLSNNLVFRFLGSSDRES